MVDQKIMQAVFYTRLFGGYGHDNELNIRKKALQKVLDEHPDWELQNIYMDNRTTNDCRDGLHQLISDAEQGEFSVVIISELNEFDDSTANSVRLAMDLKKKAIEVFVISLNLSTKALNWELLMHTTEMIEAVERSNVSDINGLWTAACSNDQELIKKYFTNTDERNIRYQRFGRDHSLIMGAFRNGHMDMCQLLIDFGETVTDEEKAEILDPKQQLREMLGL